MRIGLVGAGRIGATHARTLRDHPEVASVVVADADRDRARVLADRVGCDCAETADEMMLSGLDGIVIATGTDSHASLIVRAVRAGLPVFCEKPVALDIASTRTVLDAVADLGARVQIGFQRRFDAGYRAAKTALDEGTLGELHRVHVVTADEKPPDPSYLPGSGGFFRDCSIHDFDILRWVTGREVADIVVLGANRGAGFFAAAGDIDNAVGIMRLDDDTLVTMQGSRYNGGGYDVRMELAGSRRTVAVGLDDRAPLVSSEPDARFPAGPAWPGFLGRFGAAYHAEIDAFVDMVAGRTASPCTVEDALAALYIAEAADRSRHEGRRVAIAEVAA